jgi:curved DNA-binding protein
VAEFKKIKEAYEKITSGNAYSNEQHFDPRGFSGFQDLHDIFNMGRRAGARNWSFHGGWEEDLRNPDVNVSIPCSLEEAHAGFTKTIEYTTPNGESKQLDVTFPPGCSRDIKIKYTGEGSKLVDSLPPGDLYVRLNIAEHPVWKLDPYSPTRLHATIKITVWQAMFGTAVEIKEIDGSLIEVNIPAGIQPGSQLRLKGRGYAIRGSTHRGDAFLSVVIEIPKLNKEDEQRTIIDIIDKK